MVTDDSLTLQPSSSRLLPFPIGPETASSTSANKTDIAPFTSPLPQTSSTLPLGISPPSASGSSIYSTASATPHQNSSLSSNVTCSGATVNVPNATLDWWYETSYQFAPATFTVHKNASTWNLVPATSTFDIGSALASPAWVAGAFSSTPMPIFAATTVITQIAYVSANATSGPLPVPSLDVDPPPASIVVPGPSSAQSTAYFGTPIVYWSTYEIDNLRPHTANNGNVICSTSRESYTLPTPFAIPYDGENPDGLAQVTGALPAPFLGNLTQPSAAAGYWTASPTLVVVEQVGYSAPPGNIVIFKPGISASDGTLVASSVMKTQTSFSGPNVITATEQLEDSVTSFMLPTPMATPAPADSGSEPAADNGDGQVTTIIADSWVAEPAVAPAPAAPIQPATSSPQQTEVVPNAGAQAQSQAPGRHSRQTASVP